MVDKINEMVKQVDAIVTEGKISIDKASETYIVEYPPKQINEVFQVLDGWHCSCKSYLDKGICEHILAVNAAPRIAEIEATRPPRRLGRSRERGERRPLERRPSGARPRQRRGWS